MSLSKMLSRTESARVTLLLVLAFVLALAMLGASLVSPSSASAAAGGRYSQNHPDSAVAVTFVGFDANDVYIERTILPGQNATGFRSVNGVRSIKGGFIQCYNSVNQPYRLPLRPMSEVGSRYLNGPCYGNDRMSVAAVG